MNFKKFAKALSVAVIALTLVFALAGCGDTKATLDYVNSLKEVTESAQTVNTSLYTQIQAIDLEDESTKQAVIDSITELEGLYKKFAELKAPKKLAEVQESFKAGSEKGLEGLAMYKETFQGMTADSDMTQVQESLLEGDEIMTEAQKLIQEGLDKAEKLS